MGLIDVWELQAIDALDDKLAFRICVTNIRAKKLIEKADSFHVSFGVKVSWDARRIANTRTSDATIVYIAR